MTSPDEPTQWDAKRAGQIIYGLDVSEEAVAHIIREVKGHPQADYHVQPQPGDTDTFTAIEAWSVILLGVPLRVVSDRRGMHWFPAYALSGSDWTLSFRFDTAFGGRSVDLSTHSTGVIDGAELDHREGFLRDWAVLRAA
jgi:hypothetical protein